MLRINLSKLKVVRINLITNKIKYWFLTQLIQSWGLHNPILQVDIYSEQKFLIFNDLKVIKILGG